MTNVPQKTDSLGKRYIFKLVSNVATIPLFFVLESLLPRILGPAQYGNYNFATLLFYQFVSFIDGGSPACLSTSLSKRPDEFSLVAFYARLSIVILLFMILIGFIMHFPLIGETLMPGVPVWMAFPAAIWAYLTWLGRVIRSMNDALGITTSSEIIRMSVNITSAILLLLLYLLHLTNIAVVFIHQYLSLAMLSVGFCYTLRHAWPGCTWKLNKQQIVQYIREFYTFCGPLFIIAIASFIAIPGERWILQMFGGSTGQGYFSLSQKISMGCFLFVTAMTPLLMRDLAVAHGKGNPQEMARLVDTMAPFIYAIAAWFSCFTSVEAAAVIRIFGGESYGTALLAVQIMTLYAMHQGYGQLAGAIFYATGETHSLRNITLFGLALGLIVAYFTMAPAEYGGLHLGATGLAIKMVGVQFVTVNILLLACKRIVPFNMTRSLIHQFVCPAGFVLLALITRHTTEYIGLGSESNLVRFFTSGVLYTLLSAPAIILCPFLVGTNRTMLRTHCINIKNKISHMVK